jgi:hypothetical protein
MITINRAKHLGYQGFLNPATAEGNCLVKETQRITHAAISRSRNRCLVKETQRITHAAISRSRNRCQRLCIGFNRFGVADVL